MLQVSNLKKHYDSAQSQQTIFDDLSFKVHRYEIVALVGASGSGKTTLLNVLSGIDAADAGHVKLDGVAIHSLKEPERTLLRRHRIGFVFQLFNLIPTLSVGENIALPLELIGQSKQAAQPRILKMLQAVGLTQMQHRYPQSLSGGEQQRVAIARALIHNPDLLLADEPTGNLDEDTSQQIIRLLTDLTQQEATTMLLVTHSEAIARAADRVLRLSQGKLFEATLSYSSVEKP